jgi:phosphoenolpyruvate carboxykinase (GTP)
VGELRFDPFAMLPFCGYHMADYFGHWLETGRRQGARLPKIFMVNWFRKDGDGKFIWPGFGENSRVLAWIFRRCDGEADAVETPIGLVPSPGAIETEGLDLSAGDMERLLQVDPEEWKVQLPQVHQHYASFGDALPDELRGQLEALEQRLS